MVISTRSSLCREAGTGELPVWRRLVGVLQVGPAQVRAAQIGAFQVRAEKNGIREIGGEDCAFKVRVCKDRLWKFALART